MCRIIRQGALWLVVIAAFSGCMSSEGRYAAEYKVGLKALNKLYHAYKKVAEQSHFSTMKAEISEAAIEAKEIKKRMDELEPADEAAKERVLKKYSSMLEPILVRLKDENKRILEMCKQQEMNTVLVIKSYKTLERPKLEKK